MLPLCAFRAGDTAHFTFYLKQTMYLGYRGLQLFCIYNLCYVYVVMLFPTLNVLYFNTGTFRSMCAVPNMAILWSSLTSCFPGMLLGHFLNKFEMVPVAPVITGISFDFVSHVRCPFIIIIIIIIIIIYIVFRYIISVLRNFTLALSGMFVTTPRCFPSVIRILG
jgi:hypothetical protein